MAVELSFHSMQQVPIKMSIANNQMIPSNLMRFIDDIYSNCHEYQQYQYKTKEEKEEKWKNG